MFVCASKLTHLAESFLGINPFNQCFLFDRVIVWLYANYSGRDRVKGHECVKDEKM